MDLWGLHLPCHLLDPVIPASPVGLLALPVLLILVGLLVPGDPLIQSVLPALALQLESLQTLHMTRL